MLKLLAIAFFLPLSIIVEVGEHLFEEIQKLLPIPVFTTKGVLIFFGVLFSSAFWPHPLLATALVSSALYAVISR